MDTEKKRKLDGDVPEASGPDRAFLEQSLQRVVSVLSKEQLAAMLVQAALKHESLGEELMALGDRDVSQRKLFVRGLSWETTSEDLKAAFEEYGEIVEGAVVTDRATGKSRGFGFVTFKSMASAHRALLEPHKVINGRTTNCNLAAAGNSGSSGVHHGDSAGAGKSPGQEDLALRKLYVWGLSYDTSNEEFLDVFRAFGEILEGSIAVDKDTHKSRGFGFVTYKTAASAAAALQEPVKNITGRNVNVKYADNTNKAKSQGQFFGQGLVAGSMYNPQPSGAAIPSPYFQQSVQQYGVMPTSTIPGLPAYLQPSAGIGQVLPGMTSQTTALAAYNAALLAAANGSQSQIANQGSSYGVAGMNPGAGSESATAANSSSAAASYASQFASAAQPGVQPSGLLGYSIPGLGLFSG